MNYTVYNSSSISRITQPSSPAIDNYGRQITYLRLAVTDRCNLRCVYCMPEKGVKHIPHDEVLTFEELERLVAIFCGMGITKVRITGGEPLVRLGCVPFMKRLKRNLKVPHLHLTTNGVETYRHLTELNEIGLSGLNVSLDSLDRRRFIELARRDQLDQVLRTIDEALRLGIPLKINSVVTAGTEDDEIRALARLASHMPVSIRFIEQMAFSGSNNPLFDRAEKLLGRIYRLFPDLSEFQVEGSTTARLYKQSGFAGTIGIIEGNSRKFCAKCNKVRVTPEGKLKTCLYDDGVLDLKELLRGGVADCTIEQAIRQRLSSRQPDGNAAERSNKQENQPSMAVIGG